jgi:hypothetical protein
VASVRHPGHHQAVAELGAAVVAEPAQAVEHGPFDVILELVGAPTSRPTSTPWPPAAA